MACTIIETTNAPDAIGHYSQAISAGPFLFISGQLGLDPQTGELIDPDFELQARQALENINQIVLAAGYRMAQITSVDIFISNLSNFSKLNDIYKEYFGDHQPARAVVEVSGLPKKAGVEIKCIAYQG